MIIDNNQVEQNRNFLLIINSSSLPKNILVPDPGQANVIILDDDCKHYLSYHAIMSKLTGFKITNVTVSAKTILNDTFSILRI